MIPRYSPPDFIELWSAKTRFQVWLEVELAACEAMETAGLVPAGTAKEIRAKNVEIDADRILEIEKTVKHDVIAFLTHVEELVGPSARWLHRGMTSSDVLDSSLAVLMTRAADSLIERQERYIDALAKRAKEQAKTPMIGRSHGIHAEPITVGIFLAGHVAEAKRGLTRLKAAREEIAVGKIAGAVGTYAHISPQIEADALGALGLGAETVATQVVARDRHAAFFNALAVVAAGIERFAVNIRHMQRTELAEAEESFTKGQKGSSAMPHKRNPILSENLTGLARMVRGYAVPALENVALWHERDISHSSVERMIAPDATTTTAFMQDRVTRMVEGLVFKADNCRANLEKTGGLFFSEALLLALVHKGKPRQESYVYVQRNAMKAIAGEGSFLENLKSDEELLTLLTPKEIEACFDLDHALRFAEDIVARACDLAFSWRRALRSLTAKLTTVRPPKSHTKSKPPAALRGFFLHSADAGGTTLARVARPRLAIEAPRLVPTCTPLEAHAKPLLVKPSRTALRARRRRKGCMVVLTAAGGESSRGFGLVMGPPLLATVGKRGLSLPPYAFADGGGGWGSVNRGGWGSVRGVGGQ